MHIRSSLLVLSLVAGSARAGEPAVRLQTDPLLASLIQEVLEQRPEVQQARAAVQAERERIPQAGALPDPTLSLGIQNDGFQAIQVGKMESSFYQAMVTQPLFWPGKRGLRTEVAARQAELAEAQLARAELTAEAEVRRAYLELILVRDQLALLVRQQALWEQSEGLARARYEVGAGPQSDLLRAQLERTRLRQQRLALEAQERTRLQALNRLRGHPLDEPLQTTWHLPDMEEPALPAAAAALADAEARSPELREARLSVQQAGKRVELAGRERYPDLAVGAGVMYRGSLDPMWTLSVSVGLPIWSGRKQGRAVAESEARREVEVQGAEAVRQLVRLRTEERSPELREARLSVQQAEKRVELASRERYPDLAVGAGVMYRGSLDPMWTLSVSVGLPVWSGRKQGRAVAESEARREAEGQGAETVRQLVRLRTEERLALLDGLLEANRLYRGGLLVQSEAAAESTMGQYRVGRVTFASVLEALNGLVADRARFLDSTAQAQRIAIAQWELSLDPPAGAGAAMNAGPVPGARAMGASPAMAGGGSGGGEPAAPAASSGGM